ncbi:hypothetical protein [Haliangium sp.]|uniref:hypothetical protein n=1 Tax=Haliangium sp. TaxID=2663208 RepID=UPI003D0E1E01
MKPIGFLTMTGVLALTVGGLMACQPAGTSQTSEKLDEIDKRLQNIEQLLQRGNRGAAAQRPRRPRGPDPSKVYAVPATGPYKGAEQAKVTIVEAFEFA